MRAGGGFPDGNVRSVFLPAVVVGMEYLGSTVQVIAWFVLFGLLAGEDVTVAFQVSEGFPEEETW